MRSTIVALLLVVAVASQTSQAEVDQNPSKSRITLQPITLQPSNVGISSATNRLSEPERLSGYFKLNRTFAAEMFFFYFEARKNPETAPVVLWMTGGPGCSSELAVFYENGPWTINKQLQLEETQYGWDNYANMIFVDQPIGTGFSYSEDDRDRCYDEDCVANDMLDFIQELWQAKPELQGRDFYVTGESYAGHYCPAVAYRIYEASKSGEAVVPINLKGVAIGNGLTVPTIQYGAYADFAADNGLISNDTRDKINFVFPACEMALEVCNGLDWSLECTIAVEFCTTTQFAPILMANPGINVYDYRKQCIGDLCYDFSDMEEYLNLPETLKALGVKEGTVWESCNMQVHQDMMGDWGKNFGEDVAALLNENVPVMIYAGDKDIICNWLGNRRWVDALDWEGNDDWIDFAEEKEWMVDGELAGWVTASGPLSFVKVKDAGHMSPADRPKEVLDMITKFINGQELVEGGGSSFMRKKAVLERLARKGGATFLVQES